MRSVPGYAPLTATVLRAHSDALPEQSHVLRDHALDVARELSRLCHATGDAPQARRDRAWALHNLAERHQAVGDWEDAREAAAAAAALREDLAHDGTLTLRTEWADSLLVLSQACGMTGRLMEAYDSRRPGVEPLPRAGGGGRRGAGEARARTGAGTDQPVTGGLAARPERDSLRPDRPVRRSHRGGRPARPSTGLRVPRTGPAPARQGADGARHEPLAPATASGGTGAGRGGGEGLSPVGRGEPGRVHRRPRARSDGPRRRLQRRLSAPRRGHGAGTGSDRTAAPAGRELPGVHRSTLAQTLHNLALGQSQEGDAAAARESIREAIEHRRALARDPHGVAVPGLARSVSVLAGFHERTGDDAAAAEGFEEALEIYAHAPLPLNASNLNAQSGTALDLARAYDALGRPTEAAAPWGRPLPSGGASASTPRASTRRGMPAASTTVPTCTGSTAVPSRSASCCARPCRTTAAWPSTARRGASGWPSACMTSAPATRGPR